LISTFGLSTITSWRCIIIVPYDQLSPEALNGLIEEFITRAGTDSGYIEGSLAQSVAMVQRQLKRGDVAIVFDPATESANIVPKEHLEQILKKT
jgi:uncharacterized protein